MVAGIQISVVDGAGDACRRSRKSSRCNWLSVQYTESKHAACKSKGNKLTAHIYTSTMYTNVYNAQNTMDSVWSKAADHKSSIAGPGMQQTLPGG